jgi:hypothetical protein
MDAQPGAGLVIPKPHVPKTFGILNVIFGSILLLVGLGEAAFTIAAPYFVKMMEEENKKVQSLAKAQREATIAELKKQEAAAKSAAENARIVAERTKIESAPEDVVPDFSANFKAQGARVAAYNWSDIGSGLLLNLLMIVSGGGLIGLKEWARKLALSTAGLKVLRLLAMTAVSLTLIIPLQVRQTQEAFSRHNSPKKADTVAKPSAASSATTAPVSGGPTITLMPAGSATGMPPDPELVKVGAKMSMIASTVSAVGTLVFGSIYPLVSLWFLTRPGARAACMRRAEPDAQGFPGPM